MLTVLCRDCAAMTDGEPARCPACGGPRLVRHAELAALAIAHLDCDAFYASIEKRDDPSLADKPVVIGGRHRGVVAAACYVARRYGIRSAMPMFKALAACPHAVVIRPNMAKYQFVGRQVREILNEATPLVQPLSIDEAFLDLGGTERLHGRPPAATMALTARQIERELGITVSIGLAPNKFLAKTASDLDKPRGFAVIGRAEAAAFLAPRPVGFIWGVGGATQRRLERDGFFTIGDLQRAGERELAGRYGRMGLRLARLARGEDDRAVDPEPDTKSISAETTLDVDVADAERLKQVLWPLCERVAERLKAKRLAGRTVVLKLKTARFRLLTRSRTLPRPTQLADLIYRAAAPLVDREADGTPYRLIGIGASHLNEATGADHPDLFDDDRRRRETIERTIDAVRASAGRGAIVRGRGL